MFLITQSIHRLFRNIFLVFENILVKYIKCIIILACFPDMVTVTDMVSGMVMDMVSDTATDMDDGEEVVIGDGVGGVGGKL